MPKNWLTLSSQQRLTASKALINAHDVFLNEGRGVMFYDYQKEFREKLIEGLLTRSFNEIFYEVSRQAGKTTGIAEPVAFIAGIADMLFCVGSRPFGIGFFAPREDQYRTDWLRLRDILPDIAALFGLVPMVDNDTLMRYGRPKFNRFGKCTRIVPRIEIHGHSLGEGTRVESLTLDLAIIEEAQDIDDQKIDKMVRPMLTSTDGIIAHIGVAGYNKCYFKTGIDTGKNCVIWPYDKVIETRRRVYELTGNEYHLNYERFIEKERKRIGRQETDEWKTQYKLEWVTEVGNFISEEKLKLLKRHAIKLRSKYVRVGIDFAKEHDFTVVTITSELGQRLASWRHNGVDYLDQIPILLDWIEEWCNTHFFVTNINGLEIKEKLEVIDLKYDHTGVGNAVGETLDRKSKWSVVPVDFSGSNKAEMFQQFLNLISVGIGITTGAIADEGQMRFEYDDTDENCEQFELEATEAEKERKGTLKLLDVHSPTGKKDKFDDTLYSYGLSIFDHEQEPSLGFASV